jgi:hypothetical protein
MIITSFPSLDLDQLYEGVQLFYAIIRWIEGSLVVYFLTSDLLVGF